MYHLCSRVVDKRFVIKHLEKVRFMELARGGAAFAGIELLSWCVMDNHFHLLVRVPPVDVAAMADEEILSRLALLYSENKCAYLRGVWQRCGDEQSRARFLAPYRGRIGNLSDFMKTLKQRFSQWYNRRKNREGTLWEGRFRSVLLEHESEGEGLGPLVRFVAGYIDLNPVRAGMVARAGLSQWNSFGAAVRGDDLALAGLRILWGSDLSKRLGDPELVDRHRRMLDKDETLGAMVDSAGSLEIESPARGSAMPGSGTESGDSPLDRRRRVSGLSPSVRMSARCPEVSRLPFLGCSDAKNGSRSAGVA